MDAIISTAICWGLVVIGFFIIEGMINTVNRRVDPDAVEERYQAYRKRVEHERFMKKWKKWGLSINGEILTHFDPVEFEKVERG
jgi:hypothetical protein